VGNVFQPLLAVGEMSAAEMLSETATVCHAEVLTMRHALALL